MLARILGCCLTLIPALGLAQDYPARPVRIVVGFGPGSSADIVARDLARRLGEDLHQQVVVENRPGAAGNIATDYVAHAAKDGSTLLMATVANTINSTLNPSQNFDFGRDLAPIARTAAVPILLVTHPGLGVKSLGDLIGLAKQRPERIFYGSSGAGTGNHLAGELLNTMAGIKLVHVPYPGSAQALTDLIAGRISVLFSAASTTLPYVEDNKLVALAMAQPNRSKIAPNIPGMTESGLANFDTSVWFGLLAPAGTPESIVNKLAGATNAALAADDVVAALRAQGMEPLGGTPADFAAVIRDETAKWAKVIAAAGLKK